MGLILDSAALEALVRSEWDRRGRAGAVEAVAILKDHLNQPGTGFKYPFLPNTSSAPGEFPARQSGALYNSISFVLDGDTFEIGSFNAPPEAFKLEFDPPSLGGRPWLSRTLHDPADQAAIALAVLK